MLTRPAAAGSVTYPLRHALSFRRSGSDRLAGGPCWTQRRHHYMRDGAL